MFKSLLILGAAFASFASAQNYSTSGNISVVPDSVPIDLRMAWCQGQMNTCPEICNGRAYPNTCNPNTLTFGCECTNGPTPNISAYMQTLPFFVCQQWRIDCVAANPNNLQAITGCHSLVCGTLNASANKASQSSAAVSTHTTMISKTTSAASVQATSASTTSSKGSAATAAALDLASSYGTGLLAAGILGAFGMAL